MVVVDDAQVHIFYFVIRRKRKDQQLNRRQQEDHANDRRVPHDLLKFFDQYESQRSHSRRFLNFNKLMLKKNNAMPAMMSVCRQTSKNPKPLIMTSRIIIKNHFVGTIFEMSC